MSDGNDLPQKPGNIPPMFTDEEREQLKQALASNETDTIDAWVTRFLSGQRSSHRVSTEQSRKAELERIRRDPHYDQRRQSPLRWSIPREYVE